MNINRWRKKAISLYGTARGLTKTQRNRVTSLVGGSSTRKTSKGGKKGKMAKKGKKSWRRRGMTITGSMGWKGLVVGILGLAGVKFLIKKFLPMVPQRYVGGTSMYVASYAPVSGLRGLRSAGLIELGSEGLSDVAMAVTGGGLGAFGAQGYDV